jgi:hypothetical protein
VVNVVPQLLVMV